MDRAAWRLASSLVGWPRPVRQSTMVGLDLLLCMAAAWIAYWLRLGEWYLFSPPVLIFGMIAVGWWLLISMIARTYWSITRFTGRYTILRLTKCCAALSVCLGVTLLSLRISGVPRTLAVIHPLVFLLMIASLRLAITSFLALAHADVPQRPSQKRVLIYGAGRSGQQLADSMRHEAGLSLVGFIDHNVSLRNAVLEGKSIWHVADLEKTIASKGIDEVFLAVPSAKRHARRAIIERIRRSSPGVRVRVLPTMSQIASGRVSVTDLREVQIEELLGRDEVPPHAHLMSRDITGRRVLVTGAGGSIGSELCRQIIHQRPAAIVLAELSEHALYSIDLELREIQRLHQLSCDIHPELVNVADEWQCQRLLRQYCPQTVFHAAAYKHVPLVEANPIAGIRNNVLGTLNAALASEAAGVEAFILVSTDKAVRPTNIMGASKRLCELIVQSRSAAQNCTRYTSVRFGNVLGSSGSVIPLFRQQIRAGGPVTITHRDTTRYFMTIPEAAQLVIQAGALAEDGEVLLLDMGKPVKIIELAKAMIELSGLTVADDDNPDGDISIEEIGLRPGEKLCEELLIDNASEGTPHPRIIKARDSTIALSELEAELEELKRALATSDSARAMVVLGRVVPEWQGQRPVPPSDSQATVVALKTVGQ